MTETILICGTNWLGDSIMSMPAIQILRHQKKNAKICMLVKPKLVALWRLHKAIDEIIEAEEGAEGTLRTVRRIKKLKPSSVYILPNSFRSALLPCLAGVPSRIGMRGDARSLMINKVVVPSLSLKHKHQMWEYMDIFGVRCSEETPEEPYLDLSHDMINTSRGKLEGRTAQYFVGVVPGAAYGRAKQWPVEYFAETCRELAKLYDIQFLIFGTKDEMRICTNLAVATGNKCLNLCGVTSVPELASLLKICKVVITNDNGGMHLATAVGTPVVAVFGLTDPTKTGPLGSVNRVVCSDSMEKTRDIKKDSKNALNALKSIKPERVINETLIVLKRKI